MREKKRADDRLVCVRLSRSDWDGLQALARGDGSSPPSTVTGVVRWLVARELAGRQGGKG